MTVYEFIAKDFPSFKSFVARDPHWYKDEFNYGMANRALDFAVELRHNNDEAELKRLFAHIEAGLEQSDLENALCLDFVQRISDIAAQYEDEFVGLLGPRALHCYELQ